MGLRKANKPKDFMESGAPQDAADRTPNSINEEIQMLESLLEEDMKAHSQFANDGGSDCDACDSSDGDEKNEAAEPRASEGASKCIIS